MSLRTCLARFGLAAALLLPLPAAAFAADPTIYDPRHVPTPPLGAIPAVKPERFVLPNGAIVFLLEDHALPVVRGVAYARTSPTLVPDAKVGLAQVTGEAMRSGGTATHPGDWLDDRLAALGASLDANVGPDLANAGFRCLTENTDEVVGLWADMMRAPAYPADKIELAKVGLRRSIAARNDEMIPLLVRVATQAVYGKHDPFAREPEYATVEAIGADDCRALARQVFAPERLVLAVYGDFSSAAMKKLLTARFGDWKKSGTPAPVLPPPPGAPHARLVFAPKADVTQSGVIVAEPGSRADDPDYASLQVLEQGLGGGFASRMFNHIRTQRGLAYATGASAGTDFQRPGMFVAYSLTKSESTMTALDLVREEVRRVTEAPFTDAELQSAKQAVLNSYVFLFEDPSQTLFRSAFYQATGYPLDFVQTYQKALEGVTAQTVLAAARRKLHPDAEVSVIVGKETDFDRKLESAGLPVERVDISIPPPASKRAATPVTPEGRAKGRAWLDAAAKATGGAGAWSAVRTFTLESQATLSLQGQSIAVSGVESWALPDRQVATQKLPFGEVRQGFDGKSGWMSAMGQLQDNPKAADETADEYERSLWRLLGDPSVEVVALDQPEVVAGTSYRAAAVPGARNQDLTVLFDADGRFAGVAYQDEGTGQMGPARVAQIYSDWRPEGALLFPHAYRMLRDGQPFVEAKVTSLTLNPKLDGAAFEKPAAAGK